MRAIERTRLEKTIKRLENKKAQEWLIEYYQQCLKNKTYPRKSRQCDIGKIKFI